MPDRPLVIQLFTAPGCSNCGEARELLRQVLDELALCDLCLEVLDVVEHLDLAVSLGVLATPAIVIDGRLAITGMPSRRKLRELLGAAGG